MTEVHFFSTPAEFRAWLEENHATESELIVGFYRAAAGRAGMNWAEAVDEALCFGWIDSVRRGLDEASYTNRFTPRKRSSRWSAVNVRNVERLTSLGRMHPAGRRAYEQRDPADAGYTYGARADDFEGELGARFGAEPDAHAFFVKQAPSYRKQMVAWVTQAKREETRFRRLAALIEASAGARRLDLLRPRPASTG
ncbi:MAG: YdeI/OmpD-associated family protein [Candidatus Dormibacteraeota bacterium]|nr:YdeI/OmpD-associated family protein [Candidatus Dormibacteraeota bacterium]